MKQIHFGNKSAESEGNFFKKRFFPDDISSDDANSENEPIRQETPFNRGREVMEDHDISNVQPKQYQKSTAVPSFHPESNTVIGKGTVVNGSINSINEMKINGHVKGNLSSKEKVDVTGKVEGNIISKSLSSSSGIIAGKIVCDNNISLDAKTLVIGDLTCKDADINGRLKGNIKAQSTVKVGGNAIVYGNITAKTIDTDKGAILKGQITIVCPKSDSEIFALPSDSDDPVMEQSKYQLFSNKSESDVNFDE